MKSITYSFILISILFMAHFSGIERGQAMNKPDSYIPLDQCIPLEDIACYYVNDSGVLCVELKDIRHQMDDINNDAYVDVLEGLEDVTAIFNDRYVDMDTVIGYCGTDTGLMIYTNDGNGYYLDVEMMN